MNFYVPSNYKSYQMGTTYTVPDTDIRNYKHTGINVPWYMEWLVFFFLLVYFILFGCIGGAVILIATAYEISEHKTFWSMDI